MRELPERDRLPAYLAPVPDAVEDLGLRNVWLVVAINLVGTAFGFWFYAFETGQLLDTPIVMWPWVPDSPAATLLAAGAFASWARGNSREWLNALAFFGNLILGFWTPFVLLVFADRYLAYQFIGMYLFLFFSHLSMVVQAFVIYRISDFPPKAVGVAVAWYGLDLVVDFFIPVVGEPHHTVIPRPRSAEMWLGATALDVVAAGAVLLTLLATYLSLSIRSKKLELRQSGRG
ncbi:DUF1405 domain-containing protein [Natronoarchaeum rubrum]|uniref:DUF1405 domain-containing protein n=1 Tax=Natronoarchaeum rubrum TaxID=755311 RepID=UPI0021117EAB|nr:DUF1405 domain-containing protein [Natronoarchaeum rubrum]